MARSEQDREDILREATALVERIEFELPDLQDTVIVGFRRDRSASLFFGADPVFQFNSKGELRRGYILGQLLKAEHGHLISLERRRTANQVQLLRTELDEPSTAAVLNDVAARLRMLDDHLRQGTYKIRGQVPDSVDLIARLRDWLARLATPVAVASRPHSG